ncbi:tetratricopeptide repeat protein [uncultured Sphingomonas sp.]|uniref:tetratricopeptide repeat protein n=1 Tax=uncultured Sphingomonas sp. TaxID=158754 RepID=UPI0026183CBF|nr:tetratricopeptide repeat protein [uncultured Sphingomonas sp.]
MIPLFALLLAADDPAARCLSAARADPAEGERMAERWSLNGGAARAKHCLGLALTEQTRFGEAAAAFEDAARQAEVAKDALAASYWAAAGNAQLAAGQPARARIALDAALAAGTLQGLQRGEAHLDRARALVAAGDMAGARADLDAATHDAADDPLAWLLSATLARRTGDLPRARADIAAALKRSPDDAQVQLEAGNIAALSGDEAGAKAAWRAAQRIAPNALAGVAAAKALAQFDGDQAK